jgi:hypothetical protein
MAVVCSLLDWFLHNVCFLFIFGCPRGLFEIIVAVAVQNTFRLEMY